MPEQITITVDEETARLYREADEDGRRRVASQIARSLQEAADGESLNALLSEIEAAAAQARTRFSPDEIIDIEREIREIS